MTGPGNTLPLQGVRVLDLSWVYAGPGATVILASLGAEVILVESGVRTTHIRRRALAGQPSTWYDVNLQKKSLQLNIQHPEAREILLQLLSKMDVLVQNFRPGVMEKLGLGYERLSTMNPGLIEVAITAMGATGPEREYGGYASIFWAIGGGAARTGYQDEVPGISRSAPDMVVSTAAAMAAIAALIDRARTGRGTYIDISCREVITSLVPDALLEYQVEGRQRPRDGNRRLGFAPHDCYPCQGRDAWVSIAVRTDQEWRALCGVMDRPALLADPRFADSVSRQRHRAELDAEIAAWTRTLSREEVTVRLQAVGVAAFPSMSYQDLTEDPHLRARGVFGTMHQPDQGTRTVFSRMWRADSGGPELREPAPLLGQHTDEILTTLLGMDAAEIARLRECGALQ